MPHPRSFLLVLALASACGESPSTSIPDAPADLAIDLGPDLISADVRPLDVSSVDAAADAADAATGAPDAGAPDASPVDTSNPDASVDARVTADLGPIMDAPSSGDASVGSDAPVPPDAAPRTFLGTYPLSARFPEGGTYDPGSHRFYVGSLADGSVHRINATSGLDEVIYRETAPGRWWTLGMDVDVARRRLAVCSLEDRRAAGESSHPYDGYVLVFDLDTGLRVARHALAPAFATATCTDVAFSADGGIYVCDREHPKIYRISAGGALSTFVTDDLLSGGAVGQNALLMLPDQSALLSLIYLPSRLVRVGIADRRVTDVALRGTFFDGLPLLSGADGMTLSGSNLLVAFTSQVTRVSPTLADWSAGAATTIDVPAGMTDMIHTPAGDYLLNGQSVSFAFDRATTPFQLVRFLGSF